MNKQDNSICITAAFYRLENYMLRPHLVNVIVIHIVWHKTDVRELYITNFVNKHTMFTIESIRSLKRYFNFIISSNVRKNVQNISTK